MIDLHSHTCFSDGTDSPEELALAADEAGLEALALTDHDSMEGLPRFLAMQPRVKARLLPGVELSCLFLGRSLHVLGLFVDPGDAVFNARLTEFRLSRDDRNRRMLARLNELGVPLTLEQVEKHRSGPVVSRVHVALAMVETGAVKSLAEAFNRYLADHAPGFVPRQELDPATAARWIREAGGLPLIAHPGRFAGRGFGWEDAVDDLQRAGMAGLEAYYGEYGPAEQAYFLDLAARKGMVPGGGSDYHGANKPGIRLGVGRGRLRIPAEVLEGLEAARAQGAWN
jgi:hypothetical protein